jgi:hypothetical protein
MSTPTAAQIAAAREGKFTAVFARGSDAAAFYARITSGEFYAANVKLNRKGGRTVTFELGREVADEGGKPGWRVYWDDMTETVGYYGSTFGEYPNNAGRVTAYLNGLAGPASM